MSAQSVSDRLAALIDATSDARNERAEVVVQVTDGEYPTGVGLLINGVAVPFDGDIPLEIRVGPDRLTTVTVRLIATRLEVQPAADPSTPDVDRSGQST